MIRYGLAALALKAFSMNSATRGAYRQIGNLVGGRKRESSSLHSYIARGNLLVDMYRKHDALGTGDHLLELGSGWMHWYAIYLRLFNDIRVTTLDIWDNRQFAAFKSCFSRLRESWRADSAPPERLAALDSVVKAESFDEVYELLNFENVIVPDGSTAQFPDFCFSSVFSMHVLEHVPRELVPRLVKDMFRITQPGRITVHQIGIDDHLSHYDAQASMKQYLSYSRRTWSVLFENQVQYINRLQMSDWIREFEEAGFVLLDKVVASTDIKDLKVSEEFSHYSPEDLACTILTLVFRRPHSPE